MDVELRSHVKEADGDETYAVVYPPRIAVQCRAYHLLNSKNACLLRQLNIVQVLPQELRRLR